MDGSVSSYLSNITVFVVMEGSWHAFAAPRSLFGEVSVETDNAHTEMFICLHEHGQILE